MKLKTRKINKRGKGVGIKTVDWKIFQKFKTKSGQKIKTQEKTIALQTWETTNTPPLFISDHTLSCIIIFHCADKSYQDKI